MARFLTTAMLLGAVGLVLPAEAEAGKITIGAFGWEEGPIFGPTFGIVNDTFDVPDARLHWGFTGLKLTVTFDDQTTPLEDLFPAFVGFDPNDIGGNSFTTSDFVPSNIFSVRLQFTYTPDELPELFYDQTFLMSAVVFDQGFFEHFIEIDVEDTTPPPAPIPEPASMFLVSTGLGCAALRRYRSRKNNA